MTTTTRQLLADLEIGDRLYYRGRHHVVIAVGFMYGSEPAVQIVREGRTKGRFGWITLRALNAAHAERSGS